LITADCYEGFEYTTCDTRSHNLAKNYMVSHEYVPNPIVIKINGTYP